MATSTPNHGLYKYEGGDAPDLTKLSPTMDKIDLELKKNADNIGLLQENRAYNYQLTDMTTGDYQKVLREHYMEMPSYEPCHFRLVLNGAHRVGYGFRAGANYAVYSVIGYSVPYEVRCVLNNGVWSFTTI